MTWGRLLWRSLLYHWQANLAVLLGVAVGSAVLAGALIVGDSLRASLRDRAIGQLGWVRHAMVGGRFFREALAGDLPASQVCPAILLQGTAVKPWAGQTRRAGHVSILGVDDRFWPDGGWPGESLAQTEVVLNEELARELGARPGDTVTLHLPRFSAVPRESALGRRDAQDVVDAVPFKVAAVIGEDRSGNFSLQPSAGQSRNAFLPLKVLQRRLHQSGRVNALLAGEADAGELARALRRHVTLDDWGLTFRDPQTRARELFAELDRSGAGRLRRTQWQNRIAESVGHAADRNVDGILTLQELEQYYQERRGYLDLESRQLLLDGVVADAAMAAAAELKWRAAPTLVYLANTIANGGREIPYSVIAALDPTQTPPLGPFLPPGAKGLKDDEIVLADWKESPLKARLGDRITIRYFEPEGQERAERTASFWLKGLVPLAGPADDPDLTPGFPGITDKLDIRAWDPPFPYDNKRIKKIDEDYWNQYRTTPKAYITLAAGQALWASRFGQLTSIRFAPPAGEAANSAAEKFRSALLDRLDPDRGGLVFDDLRQRALLASRGGADFGGLFLGFSIFLIVAALLLVGLLVRLNLERRAPELGLLLATGTRQARLRAFLLQDGGLIALAGALAGLLLALGYAWLLLQLLGAWWPGGIERSFFRLHPWEAGGLSLWIGAAAAWLASTLTIVWGLRVMSRTPPPRMLAGRPSEALDDDTVPPRRRRWARWLAVVALILSIPLVVMGARVENAEEKAMAFFGSGLMLLVAGLAAARQWMVAGSRHERAIVPGTGALARLGVFNAARHPMRSLLTVGLLSSAIFLVAAVESFHRDPDVNPQGEDSGTGGFALVGESDLPVYQDLNSPRGRDELHFPDAADRAFQGLSIYACRLRAGDDVSCLNLYEPHRPRLVGLPHDLIERGSFRFQSTAAETNEERANPWRLLEKTENDTVPAIGDANTVEWMLHSKLGGIVEVPSGRGETVRLKIVGLLDGSIFQSELLVSEKNFLNLYPGQSGYQFFLIGVQGQDVPAVTTMLENALAEQGFEATSTQQRLATYLAVENTYLATFQALGALGLLLGACGLAVVLLRTVWERRAELALFRALGFGRRSLEWLVLVEHGFLLLLGTSIGAIAAVVAAAPHLLGAGEAVPWLRLLVLLAAVSAVGLGSAALAVRSTLRAPLVPALRQE
jgi:ABC-type antimicrobial peptide transport system permease subunit